MPKASSLLGRMPRDAGRARPVTRQRIGIALRHRHQMPIFADKCRPPPWRRLEATPTGHEGGLAVGGAGLACLAWAARLADQAVIGVASEALALLCDQLAPGRRSSAASRHRPILLMYVFEGTPQHRRRAAYPSYRVHGGDRAARSRTEASSARPPAALGWREAAWPSTQCPGPSPRTATSWRPSQRAPKLRRRRSRLRRGGGRLGLAAVSTVSARAVLCLPRRDWRGRQSASRSVRRPAVPLGPVSRTVAIVRQASRLGLARGAGERRRQARPGGVPFYFSTRRPASRRESRRRPAATMIGSTHNRRLAACRTPRRRR